MDPLSVGASVIAVVGATGKVIKGIHRLKALQNAPRELDDLLAETSQFELVVQAVRNAHQAPRPELERLLETARSILLDFETLIEYKLTEAGTSNKVDRWHWIRSSKEAERLRGQLRDVTANLVALVGVNTSIMLQEISQVTNEVRLEQRQLSQTLPAVALLVKLLEESPSCQAALKRSLGNIRQLTLETHSHAENTVARTTESKTLQVGQTASTGHPQSVLRIRNVKRVNICTSYCDCKCHIRTYVGALGIFSTFFGRGYIQTAGSLVRRTQCNVEACRARTAPHISVQYFLPQWLASRMILLWFTSSPSCAPELLLRIPRFVGRDHAAFRAAKARDIDSLKHAIMNGDCTPDDVDEGGFNLFSAAAFEMDWDIRLCLSSFPTFCDLSFLTPSNRDYAMGILAVTPLYNREVDAYWQSIPLTKLYPLIDWESHVESHALTTLHQIACGLSGLSLDFELQVSTAIDALDRDNRSALWHAVSHQRLDYVRKLLEQGADPNVGDPPLFATGFRNGYYALETVGLLIKHGMDINCCVEYRSCKSVTMLMYIGRHPYGRLAGARLEQLIRLGADIELTDEEGKTAVMHAVMSASAKALDVFIRAGARLDVRTVTGRTILHLAVLHTSGWLSARICSLCEVMCDTALNMLDLDAKDKDGHTAFDLLRIRNGPNWEGYCQSKGIYLSYYHYTYGTELKIISALEKLLRHIQASQGIPEAERYPPLGEYGSRDPEDQAVPGAWPAYQ